MCGVGLRGLCVVLQFSASHYGSLSVTHFVSLCYLQEAKGGKREPKATRMKKLRLGA